MKRYLNLSGNSGVTAYETNAEWIKVQFTDGRVYRYSYNKAGKQHVDAMKKLAVKGRGLSSYISRYTRSLFD